MHGRRGTWRRRHRSSEPANLAGQRALDEPAQLERAHGGHAPRARAGRRATRACRGRRGLRRARPRARVQLPPAGRSRRRTGAVRPSSASASAIDAMSSAPSRSSSLLPCACGMSIGPGHGGDGAIQLQRVRGRDERAALHAGLDDDRDARERGDDAVAPREGAAVRRVATERARTSSSPRIADVAPGAPRAPRG